jgi:hypothetical protein
MGIDHKDFLDWRGISPEECCPKCSGSGWRLYSSTSTWRGGIGGAAMTNGVCNTCWGSGSISRKWTDLRKMESQMRERVQEEAERYLVRRTGGTLFPASCFQAICDLLLKESRRRKVPRDYKDLCQVLASAIQGWGKKDV